MKREIKIMLAGLCSVLVLVLSANVTAQEKKDDKTVEKSSIGGEEHNLDVYGVKIGMDIPTALKAVFDNAERKPGEEKPDAMQKEGKKKKDIRVLYRNLPKGELQIVFANGKVVREVMLIYKARPTIEQLRLASSSNIDVAKSGERYDDRYSIGFVDRLKQEKLWWRDVKHDEGFDVRLSFRSGHIRKDGQLWWQTVTVKRIFVDKGDIKKFNKAFDLD